MLMQDNQSNQALNAISEKLDMIIGLLAVQGKGKDDQIKILSSLGFTSSKIEMATGIPARTVRRRSTKSKRKKS